jgi:hypothetical protein
MALVLKDRVKESTAVTGTGNATLLGAPATYQTFTSAVANASTVWYTIAAQTGSQWEVGYGTFNASSNAIVRNGAQIYASSSAGAIVDFSAGTKDIFLTYPAEGAVYTFDGVVVSNGNANVAFDSLNVSNTASFNNVTITNGTVANVSNSATSLVNKQYVDDAVTSGIDYHAPVRLEVADSQGSLTVTYNQPNGAGNGVGATLTNAGANVAFVADGITANTADRILIYNQANAVQNGVYVVSNTGSASYQWILTRSTDADSYGANSSEHLSAGSSFFIQQGNTAAGETYVCTTQGTITFGTTPINFVQISSSQIYSAGTGLSLNNTTFFLSNTAVVAGSYGNAAAVPVVTVNAQGQLTNVTNTPIVIANSSVTGLGTMSIQNANDVAISGGSVNGTAVGNSSASTGAFTTLSASSTVSGTGFSNYLNSPPSIGGTAPNTGSFTTLNASQTATLSANVVTSNLTGFLFGNNSSPVTASPTIPGASITGLGTMSTQNATSVTITGGTINGVAHTGGSIDNMTIGATTANTVVGTTITANTGFVGSGASLSALNGSNISSGTVSTLYGGTGANSLANANIATYTATGTFTGTQIFNGSTSTEAMQTTNIVELVRVSATAISANTSFFLSNGAVQYYTANATANTTVNFAFSSGTSLNTALANNDSASCTLLITNGATAFYPTTYQIDGNAITPRWQSNSAPTSGNINSIDSYSFVILKTAPSTYILLASQTQFK